MVEYKWDIVRTDTFRELYRTKDEFVKKKTKEMIDLLGTADNPLRYGEKKHGNFWAADLTKSDRLAFVISSNQIYLLKVCDHKEVYGRD